jgi:hypothetical protein
LCDATRELRVPVAREVHAVLCVRQPGGERAAVDPGVPSAAREIALHSSHGRVSLSDVGIDRMQRSHPKDTRRQLRKQSYDRRRQVRRDGVVSADEYDRGVRPELRVSGARASSSASRRVEIPFSAA